MSKRFRKRRKRACREGRRRELERRLAEAGQRVIEARFTRWRHLGVYLGAGAYRPERAIVWD